MKQLTSNSNISHCKKSIQWYLAILIFIIALAVFQDYLFSQFQNTGFYISESLLYNTLWGFFIPLSLLELLVVKKLVSKTPIVKLLELCILSITFSFVHITLFTASFVGISALIFSPSHHFLRIFKNVLSNHLYIIFLFYLVVPYANKYSRIFRQKPLKQKLRYPSRIQVKIGLKSILLATDTIQLISTDKPYTAIFTATEKYLDSSTLKELEALLNPQLFCRVHRSAILNTSYIKELKSRKNGDYDALLENGSSVRLSRHFKNNWKHLLH